MFRRILHTTDLSDNSRVAFVHALRLALGSRCRLRLLHVERYTGETDWSQYPGVRKTLVSWGKLEEDASKSTVLDLGIRPTKWRIRSRNFARAVIKDATRFRPDLVVLAASREKRFWQTSISRQVVRKVMAPILLIPEGISGFVDEETGSVVLRRILVPVWKPWGAEPCLRMLAKLATVLNITELEIYILYLEGVNRCRREALDKGDWYCYEESVQTLGNKDILRYARAKEVDLILMRNNSPRGVVEWIGGTVCERVYPEATCPVLVIPSG